MFFTDFSVSRRFRELCFGKGSATADWEKKRNALSDLVSYFQDQSEVMKTLRLHLYSHAQFSHRHGLSKEDKEKLMNSYESCREIEEHCERIYSAGKRIHSSIHKDNHGDLPSILSDLDNIESLREKHRENIAFAITHMKTDSEAYRMREKSLIDIESRLRRQ